MIRPDIKTYRKDWIQGRFSPVIDGDHFLSRRAIDFYWPKDIPRANIKKTDVLFEMEVAMPGFSKEEIKITLDGDIMTVRGEKGKKVETEKSNYVFREFDIDVAERKFHLAKGINREKINAHFLNGLLTLTFIDIPKEEERELKTVAIK